MLPAHRQQQQAVPHPDLICTDEYDRLSASDSEAAPADLASSTQQACALWLLVLARREPARLCLRATMGHCRAEAVEPCLGWGRGRGRGRPSGAWLCTMQGSIDERQGLFWSAALSASKRLQVASAAVGHGGLQEEGEHSDVGEAEVMGERLAKPEIGGYAT